MQIPRPDLIGAGDFLSQTDHGCWIHARNHIQTIGIRHQYISEYGIAKGIIPFAGVRGGAPP